ncbi:MAG TPA: hypothetical protein VMY37_32090 [Thermoguttaceae bacterium]|nr:hypothetical protein [Thermoguttaceae bacterium]
MRPLAILFVGCLPLAVLTAWSFVELGSIDDPLGAADPALGPEVKTDPADALAEQRKREKPLVDALGEVDLLSGDSLAGLEKVPEESSLRPLRDSWPRWEAARAMVVEFLQIDRVTRAASGEPIARIPLEDLDTAGRKLEALQQTCEASKKEFEKLREEHGDSSVRGAAQFLALLDDRIADLDRQIDDCRSRLDAAELLSEARDAFQPSRYGKCIPLCDELLGQYASVLAPSVAAKVQILRERAAFWDDTERLFSQLDDASPVEREAVLESFLGKYGDRAARTEAELRIIDGRAQQLREVKAQLAAEAAGRAAQGLIRDLEQNLPRAFEDRLRSTARIAERYPTDSVKIALQTQARQWLQEFLPEKQIREPPELQEAETTRHEIVRGFFADVVAPDGALFGYKRYPTLQARNDPEFDVGTYRKEEFLVPPGESVPRRCVKQYNQARQRLIEAPGRRTAWVDLADLCESLESDLREYRRKNGAAPEEPVLSFEQDGRFVRELLAGSGWADVETLFGP